LPAEVKNPGSILDGDIVVTVLAGTHVLPSGHVPATWK
jgi:hypothetical protein